MKGKNKQYLKNEGIELENHEVLAANLEKIRQFIKVWPFEDTIKTENGKAIFDWTTTGAGHAEGRAVFNDGSCAILLLEAVADSIHIAHTHKTTEILIVLNGAIKIITAAKEITLLKHGSYTLIPYEVHEVHYLTDSRLVVLTVPADESFPKVEVPKNE